MDEIDFYIKYVINPLIERQKIETNPKHPEFLHTVTGVGYKLTPFGEL